MAYDEGLAQRIRDVIDARRDVEEKKMFGGLAFLLRGHMAFGILGDELMVRVGPEAYEAALAQPHARPMDFTGKPIKGMVYVAPDGFAADEDLERWLERAQAFNATQPAKKPPAKKAAKKARSGASPKPPRGKGSRPKKAS